jgi:hypothetical protein
VVCHIAGNRAGSDLRQVKKLLAIIILVLIVVLKNAYYPATQSTVPPTTKPAPTSTPEPAPSPTGFPYRVEAINPDWPNHFTFIEHSLPQRSLDEDGYDFDVQYPQISSNEPEARRFNKWIKNKVLGYANEFQRLADAEQRRKRKQPPTLWGFDLYYVVYYSSENLVSMRLTHGVMQAGQMHPVAYYETINFDLRKGRQLRARDVFKRGYLTQLSRYSRKYLNHYVDSNGDWVSGGTEPEVGNFENWNIVPNGVLLCFEDYQVGPHSFGQPEFVVPFDAFRGTVHQGTLQQTVCFK